MLSLLATPGVRQNFNNNRPIIRRQHMLPLGLVVSIGLLLWDSSMLVSVTTGTTSSASTMTNNNNMFMISAERKLLNANTINDDDDNNNNNNNAISTQLQQPQEEGSAQEEYDAFNTPSVRCRLGIEKWQNDNIDRWIENPPWPLIEWIWEMQEEVTKNDNSNSSNAVTTTIHSYYYKGMFNILATKGRNNKAAGYLMTKVEWKWEDQYGNQYTIPMMKRAGNRNVRLYFRLDIPPPPTPSRATATTAATATATTITIRPKQMYPILPNGTIPIVYDLEPYITCNQIEKRNPPPSLLAQEQQPTDDKDDAVKQQPTAENQKKKKNNNNNKNDMKIGACITRFWKQHDLMHEWIVYHRMIGIDHFFVFVSEPFDNIMGGTMPRYETDISYIPYNYTWKGHSQKAEAAFVKKAAANNNTQQQVEEGAPTSAAIQIHGGRQYGGENWFQPSANNQCLYLAKQYGLDWVYTPDVDEYVVLLDPSIEHFPQQQQQQQQQQQNDPSPSSPPPLQQYFDKYHNLDSNPNLGEVCLYGGGWGRHPVLEPLLLENDEDNNQKMKKFQLTIDFTYRRDRKLGSGEGSYDGIGAGGRKKCFYNPRLVNDVLIHQAVKQRGTTDYGNTSRIELYHFRSPMLGAMAHEGGLNNDLLVSYPELRDMYRKKIIDELNRNNWTFPNLSSHIDAGYNSLVSTVSS